MQGRSCAIACDGMCCPDFFGHRLLKRRDNGSLCQKIRLQDPGDGVNIGLLDILSAVRDHDQRSARALYSSISSMSRNLSFVPELYSNSWLTGCPTSPSAFDVKSLLRETNVIVGWMT